MTPIKLDDSYFVLPQITVESLAYFKKEGFDLIINNRPDNEQEGQPLSANLDKVAKELGLQYVYNPINLASLSEIEILKQESALNSAEKVLAFCRTGTRSSVLWVLNNQNIYNVEALFADLKLKGFDMARCLPAMKPFME